MMDERLVSPLQCRLCNQGLLIYMYDEDHLRLYLECDECFSGYWNVEQPVDGFYSQDRESTSRLATPEEVGANSIFFTLGPDDP